MKKLPFSVLVFTAITLFYCCKPAPKGGIIENTYWTLASAVQGGKPVVLSKNTATSLVFGEGRLSGKAPCNSYFAGFSINGATLAVSEIGATKRMCDEMDQENSYLALLSQAQSYSVLKDRLEIYCKNGQLTFVPMPEDEKKNIQYEQGIGQLEAMFPVMEGDVMPHLYPILRVDNPGNYPFNGSKVDSSFYRFFDEETAEIWNSAGGDVMAVGQYGGFYICRIPGRYVSSDIALFRKESDKLVRVETVAWAWCDEGWCNQQDTWLQDVNKDDRIDLIQHYTLTDDKGKIREERMAVWVQDENGNFVEDKSLKPDKTKFKMASI